MKWEVDVIGVSTDLRLLHKAFDSDEFSLSEEDGKFVLRSPAFDNMADAADVRARAKSLITSLSGASRALLGAQKSLDVGGVTLVRADGTKNHFVLVEPAVLRLRCIPPSIRITKPDGSVEEHHPADPVRDWLEIALKDPLVAKALRLRDKGGLDWVQLYRLYDVIEGDMPQSTLVQNGWASKKDIRRFKHTANSPGVIGDEARHGKEGHQPPANPMSLSEARSLVDHILKQWLDFKIKQESTLTTA